MASPVAAEHRFFWVDAFTETAMGGAAAGSPEMDSTAR
jgi:hypothetical protein